MEDYIFLLIAVALSIFGAINKKKKQNAAEKTFNENEIESPQFSPDQFFMDDDFHGDLDETFEEAPKPKSFTAAKAPVVEGNLIPRQKYYHQTFKSTLPDRPKHKPLDSIKRIEVEEEAMEATEFGGYLEDFSLRKAFVYSEILARKY